MAGHARSPKTGFIALFIKLGPKLLSVLGKMAKVLKGGKVIMAGASFAAYAMLFSWQFAVVLIGSLVVHEYGHLHAMKKYGMKTRGIYLIPLLGAAAVAEGAFPTRRSEVDIALKGPLWGFTLALATYGVYLATGVPLVAALAGWMGMVNLFNLLPINPLDGGRVMKSIAYSISSRVGVWFLALGLVACFSLAWVFNLGLITFLLFIGALDLAMEVKEMRRERDRRAILAALADAYRVAPAAEAVIAAHGAADEGTRRLAAARAAAARTRYRRVFGGEPYFVTGFELLLSSELEEFLRGSTKPAMTPRQTALSFAAYVGLAAALIALMVACRHVPAAGAALGVFMG